MATQNCPNSSRDFSSGAATSPNPGRYSICKLNQQQQVFSHDLLCSLPPEWALVLWPHKGPGAALLPLCISHFTLVPKMPPHGPAFKRHRVPRFSPLFMGDLIAPHIKSGISPNYRPRDACQGIQENGPVQTRARGDRGEKRKLARTSRC